MSRLTPFINRAIDELRERSLNDIQVETALTWAGRACVAAHLGKLADAVEYAHEAVEHAALSGSAGLLDEVREGLERYGVPLFQRAD